MSILRGEILDNKFTGSTSGGREVAGSSPVIPTIFSEEKKSGVGNA